MSVVPKPFSYRAAIARMAGPDRLVLSERQGPSTLKGSAENSSYGGLRLAVSTQCSLLPCAALFGGENALLR